jgi:hypothetical protein
MKKRLSNIIEDESLAMLSDMALREIAKGLPIYPPLKPLGEVTIREMYPELTENELVVVMKYYKGYMKLG